MVDKNKSLKVKSNSIFEKISNFFKNIFKKKYNEIEKEEIHLDENIKPQIEEIKCEEKEDETEKKEFFKLYQDVKSGNVKLDELDTFDLIRINLMLTQEIDIQTNNVHKELENIQNINEKIIYTKRNNLIA